jgi:PhnB protein
MISPENTVRGYSLTEFIRINPKSSFHTRNSFCDEKGNPINNVFSLTTNSFKSRGEITTVHIEKKFDDLSALETMITMGYKEGLAMALTNLDEYFSSLVTSK